MIYRENPAKNINLTKNPPKYTTAYIVQQSNYRWHCEPSFFLRWAFNNEKWSSHPPSLICLFPISPSISLSLQTLSLVSLVSLIIQTKRISERSAIMTG
jgi:hypothetical protein